MTPSRQVVSWTVTSLLMLLPAMTSAQEANPYSATRHELRSRLDSLLAIQDASASSETNGVTRRVRVLERRLSNGDFRPGDQVRIVVEGQDSYTGNYTLTPEVGVDIPQLEDAIPLDGVLYSEADSVIRTALARYIQNPEVRVRPLVRIGVLGAVNDPGYYHLMPTSTVADVLMAAGGPAQQAKVGDLQIQRGERDILEGREANVDVLTLAELGAQPGDRVYVPSRGGGLSFQQIIGVLGAVGSLTFAITEIF